MPFCTTTTRTSAAPAGTGPKRSAAGEKVSELALPVEAGFGWVDVMGAPTMPEDDPGPYP
ncbi:hypothetical protein BE08_31195 [Sorangium cellulosum]|uniref:Uncharacterized protein n=1 Tax=Sorangium cellulosum TaxID=56 RepID=A0A150PTB6_SORCE|nr:hypothetical protein BE08_31195 [Sorangium cellulosum]